MYPSLQVQKLEPAVLVQFALTSQAWLPLLHSSPSLNESNYDLVNNDEQASWFPLYNLGHEGSLTNCLHFPLIRTILGSREAHPGVTNIRETP